MFVSLFQVAIADHDGVLTCFGMKKGEAVVSVLVKICQTHIDSSNQLDLTVHWISLSKAKTCNSLFLARVQNTSWAENIQNGSWRSRGNATGEDICLLRFSGPRIHEEGQTVPHLWSQPHWEH